MKRLLNIGWLYPDLMSTYGDRGNITVLKKRLEWRGIDANIQEIRIDTQNSQLSNLDLIVMGGAEDRQQEIVASDLKKGKAEILTELIEAGTPGIYICGAYQFLGQYYKEADGNIIKGLGIFDLYTQSPSLDHARLIGNIATKVDLGGHSEMLIGFENHGGRTYLGKAIKPFGQVVVGFGNNSADHTEGAIHKNSFGTYLHGPVLSKNPVFADYLLKLALDRKYDDSVELKAIDDRLEVAARDSVARKLKIEI